MLPADFLDTDYHGNGLYKSSMRQTYFSYLGFICFHFRRCHLHSYTNVYRLQLKTKSNVCLYIWTSNLIWFTSLFISSRNPSNLFRHSEVTLQFRHNHVYQIHPFALYICPGCRFFKLIPSWTPMSSQFQKEKTQIFYRY